MTEEPVAGWNQGISKLDSLVDIHKGAWVYVFITASLSLMAAVGAVWLMATGDLRTGVLLGVATAAFITYAYNAHFNRRAQIEAMTMQVMTLFRERRDTLAGDSELLSILTGEVTDLSPVQRMKLECYLYSLFDAYLYAFYLIRWGYLDNRNDLSLMFRNMIAKSISMSHVIATWEREVDGEKVFQNEYRPYLISIVNEVVAEAKRRAGNN